MASEFEEGLLVGILVGEGHFGGDGRQPQVTLRMHERHAPLFRWIERTVPGGRLYGPYDHGGRRYYQWMARGAFLRDTIVPILDRRLTPALDAYAHERFLMMKEQYQRQLGPQVDGGPASGRRRSEAGPPGEDGERRALRRSESHPAAATRAAATPTAASSDAVDLLFSNLRQAGRPIPEA